MTELYLVYINRIGEDWLGDCLYECLFSDSLEVDGDDWDAYPASGRPSPPNQEMVKLVGNLKTDIPFKLVQDSDTFAVWDAVDGVVALAWEDVSQYSTYPETTLHFHFGATKESVEAKLYEKDLVLEYNKIKKPNK
tara:strand:- start:487 stop:894 length:408 start_codon:yes stop_codon:yes gene_type:complete